MFRQLCVIVVGVAAWASGARAEISPPPPVPTLHSVEWTVGVGVAGTSLDRRGSVVVGLAFPVARVGTESELYLGVESGIAPVWSPFAAVVPLLARSYVRTRLSEATALRFGIATGALVAIGSGAANAGFLLFGTPAFDLHFTKHTRVVFEPALGLGHASTGTYFFYYPRVMLGFSL